MADKKELQILLNAKDNASKEIKGVNEGFSKMTKVAGAAALAVGAVGAAFGVKVIKEFADFEKGMSTVKAITNATGEEFKALNDLAKEMGRTTAFTAKEAGDAMTYLGMAGFDTNEIMSALPGTLNLAAAANVALGRAADIASNVLTGFQLDTKETERVIDVLTKTLTTSNTDLEQLSEAMKYFAPTAAAFGVSLEEASAAVGLMGNAGIQGSLATRAFGTALTRLAKPTKKMEELMDELGIKFFDTEGRFVGLAGMIGLLEGKLGDATDEYKQFVLSTLFGMEAIQEMNVLLAIGSEGINEYTQELEASGGTAQRMADTQLDNLHGAFTILKSAVSGLMIEMGEKLAPVVRILADSLTAFIGIVKDTGGIVEFLRHTFGVLMQFIEDKTGLITVLKTAFDNVATVFMMNLIPQIKRFWEIIQPIMPFIEILAKIVGVVLLGALIAVAKILEITLIAAIAMLSKGIETANFAIKLFVDYWQTTINTFKTAYEWITKLIDKIKQLNVVQGAKNAISGMLGFGGGKAIGGPVSAGTSYLVGERGPELFTPGSSGFITPNNKLGGGLTINITGNTLLDSRSAEKIGDMIINKLGMTNKYAY
jgi:TP901 family phage tail tape measure protein